MNDLIADYIEGRFSALEAADFKPIASSRCLMVQGTIRRYRELTKSDQLRFRRVVARLRVAHSRRDARTIDDDPDKAWYGDFTASCFPPEYPDERRPLARAPELRKVARLCFEQLLGAKPRRSEGNPGDWLYEGSLYGVPVSVELRYACTMTQIQYGVRMDGMAPYTRLSAEMLYGLGLGWWNRVYLDDIDQAFGLLRELVTIVVQDHLQISKLIAKDA